MLIYHIKTFGCQMNHSDSERVATVLENAGFIKGSEEETDVLIVNTCSVRQRSEDKAVGFMTQFKKDHPNSKITVTGCMVRQTGDAQNSKDPLLRLDPIDFVFRIEDAARVPKMLEPHFPDHDFETYADSFGSGSIENYFRINPKTVNKTQVYLPIMQGCDKFCTFCIVPYTRGRELSRPLKDVFEECEKHVKAGAKEITLLGQNVNSYRDGLEGEKCFAKLLKQVDTLYDKGLSRIRFTSAHPQDFTDDVIEALSNMQCRCPYIHLPVQHGCNEVLRSMNRNYKIEKYKDIIAKIRKAMPDTTLATDIIVGFPGETDAQFQTLCDFAQEMKFDFSYTAIYSPRKHTAAARMEKDFIPANVQKERFAAFDTIVNKFAWEHRRQFIGKTVEVLVEKSEIQKNGRYKNVGRSREFFEVWFESGRPFLGKEVAVEIQERKRYVLHGILPEVEIKGMQMS